MLSSAIYDWLRVPVSDALVDACVKASFLLVVTGLAALLLRHRSAAVRHRLWCLGFCGALALPVLSLTLPRWRLPLLPAQAAVRASPQTAHQLDQPSAQRPASGSESVPVVVSESPEFRPHESTIQEFADRTSSGDGLVVPALESPSEPILLPSSVPAPPRQAGGSARVWLIGMWLTGLVITLLPFCLGLVTNWWTLRRSRHLRASHWTRLASELAAKLGLARRVTLLETRKAVVPMTCGVLRPVVLLPRESNGWNDARRRVVLLHELAHIKRLDVLFQLIARLACALYWFHPLAWYALWRLRVERELACDDCVVATGERPTDYASQLVQIARAYQPMRFSVGVAMARSTKLEQRIVAMLDQARSHLPVGKQFARTLLASCCVLVLGLSVVGLGERATKSAETGNAPAGESGTEAGMARGRVVNESGEPIANAHIYTVLSSKERYTWETQHRVVAETKADRDGRFRIDVPTYDAITAGERYLVTHSLSLLAVAEGFGPDAYHEVDKASTTEEITLTLAQDSTPLEGRVLDLEGHPVPGVRVRLRSIRTTDADLDAWLAKASHNPRAIPDDVRTRDQVRRQVVYFPTSKHLEVNGLAMFAPVLTDAKGCFRLSGLGRDRLVSLELEGAKLAKDRISAVTRSMPPVPLPTSDPRSRTERCFGASFDYTAEPAQVITGTLRDLDSGQPIAGATVQIHQFANSLLGVSGFVASTTDESGRYQLVGIPKPADGARPIRLEVLPSPDQPYFRTAITLSKRVDGLGPVSFDIELKRTTWVSGRLIDQQSGEPVTGYASYYPFIDNTAAVAYSNFEAGRTSIGHDNWYRTAANGSYRIPAIRGRGVVVARALAAPDYAIGAGADEIGWEANPQDRLIYHLYGPELANAIREVNIDADETTNQDVALVPLSRQRIQLFDPNGLPLTGVHIGGRRPASALNETDVFHQAEPQEEPSVEALGLQADGRRLMLFSHSDRKLGKAMVADGTTESVTLEPLATFSGRVIDATGKPVEGQYVNVVIPKSESPESNDKRAWGRRDQYLAGGRSDSEGRFHFDNVLPGTRCDIVVNNQTLASRDVVEPGDVVDFGNLQLASNDEEAVAADVSSNTTSDDAEDATRQAVEVSKPATFTIAGRVLGPDGTPVSGAKLYFAPHQHATPQDLQVRAVTDGSGKFSFPAPESDLERLATGLRAPWNHPRVTARFDGLGPDWQYIVEPEGNEDLTLRLVRDDVPITGRVVTIEGRAVPGATIHVLRVEASPQENLQEWLNALNNAGELWAQGTFKLTKTLGQDVSGLPAQVRTDEEGRFRITGLGRERVVNLRVEGSAIETREFSAMSRGKGTIRVPYDKEEPSHGTLICYATDFSHPAAPSRPLVGTVVDAVSGQPVSGVTVFCYKRAGNPVHGRYPPETVTDENGKFLLTGLPKGVDNKIQFLPSPGQRHSPMVQTFDTRDGLEPLVVEVKLNPGVLISGRVTDDSTGQPVPGAEISYFALRNENLSLFPGFRNSDDITATTDAHGRYQIFGLPGRGLIAVRAKSHEFAAGYAIDTVEADSRFEAGIADRGFITEPRICLASQHHAVAVVEAKEDGENVRDIPLLRGHTLTIKVVGPDGQPFSGAEVNRQGVEACQLRGGEVEIDGSEFTAWGLTEGKPRTLFVRHRAHGLAAARVVRHDDPEPIVIRLEPSGTIVGRLLDQSAPASFVEFTGGVTSNETQQHDWLRVTSDEAGRFRIEGLVPGQGYRLRNFQRTGEGYVFSSRASGEPVEFIVKSGETLDLGDVIVE